MFVMGMKATTSIDSTTIGANIGHAYQRPCREILKQQAKAQQYITETGSSNQKITDHQVQ